MEQKSLKEIIEIINSIFCNNVNVFTVTFDNFLKKNKIKSYGSQTLTAVKKNMSLCLSNGSSIQKTSIFTSTFFQFPKTFYNNILLFQHSFTEKKILTESKYYFQMAMHTN